MAVNVSVAEGVCVMPRDLTGLSPGEQWAYRRHHWEPVACVEVLKLGSSKPLRVLVEFQGDEFEGRQEWVPPARLKVLWAEVDEWLARERRWAALREASGLPRDSTEDNALSMLFDYLPDWGLARSLYNNEAGILEIRDVEALTTDLDLDHAFIVGDPASFVENGSLFVPWRVTEVIAERLARKYSDEVMEKNEASEREAREHNRWGYMGSHGHISAEICAEVDEKYQLARDLVRQWCGVESQDRYDELVALRVEVVRLGKLVERAISAVHAMGDGQTADALERELGIPLDAIRHAGEDRRRAGQGP